MITALIIIYIMLKIKSKIKISKIQNPRRIKGKVSGYEIRVHGKKKWTYDVVSFEIDNDIFTASKTSSPFYLKSHSNIGEEYEIVYNEKQPNENIIIDNTVFTQLKFAMYILSSIYIAAFIAIVVQTLLS